MQKWDYTEYFETIRKSSNPKAKALELFGAEYANNLNGYRNDNSESDLTLISRTVKAYMSKKYKSKELFDSVTVRQLVLVEYHQQQERLQKNHQMITLQIQM